MKYTTLGDLNLYLTHLLQDPDQQNLLGSLLSWKLFGPLLQGHHEALRGLPPALIIEGKALAAELREADADHDAAYRAIHHLLRAYVEFPHAPEHAARAQQAQALLRVLTPDLGLTRASYADEAHEATARQALLQPLDAQLDAFPVTDGTLRAWVQRLDASAHRLAELLALRAHKDVDNLSTSTRGEALKLRADLMGALQSFRAALRAELAQRADVAADTEARVFQMLDNLASSRDQSATRASNAATPA
jgi:hypothetical protein